MDTLHLSESAGILDVYDHEYEEKEEQYNDDFDDIECEEGEDSLQNLDEEELDDDLTSQQVDHSLFALAVAQQTSRNGEEITTNPTITTLLSHRHTGDNLMGEAEESIRNNNEDDYEMNNASNLSSTGEEGTIRKNSEEVYDYELINLSSTGAIRKKRGVYDYEMPIVNSPSPTNKSIDGAKKIDKENNNNSAEREHPLTIPGNNDSSSVAGEMPPVAEDYTKENDPTSAAGEERPVTGGGRPPLIAVDNPQAEGGFLTDKKDSEENDPTRELNNENINPSTPQPLITDERWCPGTITDSDNGNKEEHNLNDDNYFSFMMSEEISPGSTLTPNDNLIEVFHKVNDDLGGKEAMEKIDENMKAAALQVKVQMLRDTTKNLQCSQMVDVLFGCGDTPKKPSPHNLRRLRNIIAAELTIKEFIKSSKVTDLDSANLFRQSNENLEMIQRQQIMSNPLFSEISSAHLSQVEKGQNRIEDEEEDIRTPEENLHIMLHKLSNSKEEDPCNKLSNRISFLNSLIYHKTASNIMWAKLINVVSGVFSQVADVLFGNGDEQNLISESPSAEKNLGSLGVDFFFGTASHILERNMSKICTDIGELALCLNIPVVLIHWPQEYVKMEQYKNILMRSIHSFSVNVTLPPMYIINQIMFDDDEESENICANEEQQNKAAADLFSEENKKTSINKLFNEIRGGGQEREFMRAMFQEKCTTVSSSSNDSLNVYSVAATIIDYKIPIFDNIMKSVVTYIDDRKHLINKAIVQLMKKAKLNITVYRVKNKLNSVSARENASPTRNLMYRAYRHRDVATKRPPTNDIMVSRIKKLKQWDSDQSEMSDG